MGFTPRALVILAPLFLIVFSQNGAAYTLNEVANHTMTCGPHLVRFGPDARIASLDGMRIDVLWDDDGISAEIGSLRFEVEDGGRYELAGEACTFAR